MKTVICNEPGDLAMIEREKPSASEGHTLLKVSRVGICGTDLHIFGGKHPFLEYPRVIGHEFSGEVVESLGDGALAEGAQVIVNPYLACGTCRACRKNKPNCCTNISVLGVHADGALQEYVVVPNRALIPYDGLRAEEAASVEFLAVGMHAINRSGLKAGDEVLVAGAGPIGIGTALIARSRGARVIMLDMNVDRLANVAERFGFDETVQAGEGAMEALKSRTNSELFDIVFDATGNVHSIHASFTYVGQGGTLCLVSVVKDDITFPDPSFHAREMTIIGSRNSTNEDFADVVALIKSGDLDVSKLVTHEMTLDEVPSKFLDLPAAQDSLIKAMISL